MSINLNNIFYFLSDFDPPRYHGLPLRHSQKKDDDEFSYQPGLQEFLGLRPKNLQRTRTSRFLQRGIH